MSLAFRISICLILSIVVSVPLSVRAQAKKTVNASEPLIRVCVLDAVPAVSASADSEWSCFDKAGKLLGQLKSHVNHSIEFHDGALTIATPADSATSAIIVRDLPLTMKAGTTESVILLGSTSANRRKYMGAIELRAGNDGKITVISHLPMEEYLRGVVPSEIGSDAPDQAKCAQAVAARSFAVLMMAGSKHKEDHYDICPTVHCQVYSGLSKVNGSTDAAVRETRGTILTFKGKPIAAYYSALCGGHTEDIRNIWPDRGGESAYHGSACFDGTTYPLDLRKEADFRKWVASDPVVYCNPAQSNVLAWAGKNFRWNREFTAEEVTSFVSKRKNIGRVLAIKPGPRGESGRYTQIELVGENGTEKVSPEIVIRRMFEPALRSGAFTIDTKGPAERPTHFIFTGTGSGHAVGMCQTGAMGMANAGKNFHEILAHYYNKAKVEKLY